VNIEAVVKKQAEAMTRIADVYSAAKTYAATSAWINVRINKIVFEDGKNLPRWAQQYLLGYANGIGHEVQRDHIIYGIWDGINFYSVVRARDDYYENTITIREFANLSDRYEGTANKGSWWAHKPERPFFNQASADRFRREAEEGVNLAY